jgi:hypothetical protein
MSHYKILLGLFFFLIISKTTAECQTDSLRPLPVNYSESLKSSTQISFLHKTLLSQKIDWSTLEFPCTKKDRNSYFSLVTGNEYFRIDEEDSIDSDFHLVDFTKDGLPDLIYAGRMPTGGEIDNMAFFVNDGDSLRIILKLIGSITSLNIDRNESELIVWRWPCCAEYMNSITYYNYTHSDTVFYFDKSNHGSYNQSYGVFAKNYHPNFKEVDRYTFVSKTLFPSRIDLKVAQNCFVLNDSAIMSSNPNLDIEEPAMSSFIIPQTYKFNFLIARLPANTKASILYQHLFKNELYYLIKIDLAKANSPLESIQNSKVKGLLGWVKSTDIGIPVHE